MLAFINGMRFNVISFHNFGSYIIDDNSFLFKITSKHA